MKKNLENGLPGRLNEIKVSVKRKLMKELVDQGLIKSFREIKNMDRIDVSGVTETGMQRLIWNEIRDVERGVKLPEDFYLYIPFVKEGVLKYNTSEISFYHHFKVCNVDYETKQIELETNIYKYRDGLYLFDSAYNSFFRMETEPSQDISFSIGVNIDDIKTISSLISEMDLKHIHFTEEEKNVFDFLVKESKQSTTAEQYYKTARMQVQYFVTTIAGINYCIEQEKTLKKELDVSGTGCVGYVFTKNEPARLADKEMSKKGIKRREVILWNGVKISQGEDSQIKIRRDRIVNRYTDVWGVAGHTRHLKSGKVIYIKPYKKGPGRANKEPQGKVYKVEKPKQKESLEDKIKGANAKVDIKNEKRSKEHEKVR